MDKRDNTETSEEEIREIEQEVDKASAPYVTKRHKKWKPSGFSMMKGLARQ